MEKLIQLLYEFFNAGKQYNQACIDNGMNGGLDTVFYEPDSLDEFDLVNQKQTKIAEAIEELFETPLYLHRVYNDNGSKVLITSSSEFPSKEFGLYESGIGTVFQHNCKSLNKI